MSPKRLIASSLAVLLIAVLLQVAALVYGSFQFGMSWYELEQVGIGQLDAQAIDPLVYNKYLTSRGHMTQLQLPLEVLPTRNSMANGSAVVAPFRPIIERTERAWWAAVVTFPICLVASVFLVSGLLRLSRDSRTGQ